MSLSIRLTDHVPFYTNLDIISGLVILDLTSDESVSAIQVKLEGEAKTRLANPNAGARTAQRQQASVMMELHKVNHPASLPEGGFLPSPRAKV